MGKLLHNPSPQRTNKIIGTILYYNSYKGKALQNPLAITATATQPPHQLQQPTKTAKQNKQTQKTRYKTRSSKNDLATTRMEK
jgi:hypothetical protein